jgi:hypothetical protein
VITHSGFESFRAGCAIACILAKREKMNPVAHIKRRKARGVNKTAVLLGKFISTDFLLIHSTRDLIGELMLGFING